MSDYEDVREQLVSYFFTELASSTKPEYVENIAQKWLSQKYSDEWIEKFWSAQKDIFHIELLGEYNDRITDKVPVFFEFVDEDPAIIKGKIINSRQKYQENFQKALLKLDDYEFEKLSARLLSIIGCSSCWCTSKTNDQGIDAFGCFSVFQLTNIRDEIEHHKLWILVQAKHYVSEKVSANDIRNFIGASYLAKYKVYAVNNMKYGELDLKPNAPLSLFFVTSGEIKWTARLLAKKAGITLITSLDIFSIISDYWAKMHLLTPNNPSRILSKLKSEITHIPLAC
jgi:hypothetical protein